MTDILLIQSISADWVVQPRPAKVCGWHGAPQGRARRYWQHPTALHGDLGPQCHEANARGPHSQVWGTAVVWEGDLQIVFFSPHVAGIFDLFPASYAISMLIYWRVRKMAFSDSLISEICLFWVMKWCVPASNIERWKMLLTAIHYGGNVSNKVISFCECFLACNQRMWLGHLPTQRFPASGIETAGA